MVMEENVHGLFLGTIFLAGLLSFFSPCVFPLLPVYLGKLADDTGTRYVTFSGVKIYLYPIIKTLFFIAGLSTVFFSLGFGTGFFGSVFYHPYTPYIMGMVVILLGLHQMELINIHFLQQEKKVDFNSREKGGVLGAFLLGLSFSFGWTPCVGPVLGSVLAFIASENSTALYGGFLMIIYTAGMAVPFLLLAAASSWLMKYFVHVKKHMLLIKRIGGVLIILMGILLMSGRLEVISSFFNTL